MVSQQGSEVVNTGLRSADVSHHTGSDVILLLNSLLCI